MSGGYSFAKVRFLMQLLRAGGDGKMLGLGVPKRPANQPVLVVSLASLNQRRQGEVWSHSSSLKESHDIIETGTPEVLEIRTASDKSSNLTLNLAPKRHSKQVPTSL